MKQIHTVKHGVLYRLAGALAIEAEWGGGALDFSKDGLGGDTVGPRPPWLEEELRAIAVDAERFPAVTSP